MWKIIVTVFVGVATVAMCQEGLTVAHPATASPQLDKGVFAGRTYKNASIGLELTPAPALRFGIPELKGSPARLINLGAWNFSATEGIIFSADALSYYPIGRRSTEDRLQSFVRDLSQVGFEPIEGSSTESKLGAVKFARSDFDKVGKSEGSLNNRTQPYEAVFVKSCSSRELVFIFYGPDRESINKREFRLCSG
jgi:hypothetical protein